MENLADVGGDWKIPRIFATSMTPDISGRATILRFRSFLRGYRISRVSIGRELSYVGLRDRLGEAYAKRCIARTNLVYSYNARV